MKRSMFVLLCLWMLLSLGGCGSLLYREYGQVQPHSSTYYESGDRSVLRAESYQDVVNDLLLLISDHEESGSIWFYPGEEGPDASQIAQQACQEVQLETPLGSYAVEYLTYTIDSTARNYVEIAVTIGYRRTASQVDGIIHATSISALYDLINDRLLAGKSTVVSTNLSPSDLAGRYSPAIASRLTGSYTGLPFFGRDIRQKKRG